MSTEGVNVEENDARQREEIEALSAIYGEDFLITDKENKIYEVRIRNELNSKYSTSLRFVLPAQYPSNGEPWFEIHSSWMNSDDYQELTEKFHEIFSENDGEILLFQWIEKLRDFVESKAVECKEPEQTFPSVEYAKQETNREVNIVETVKDIKLTDYNHDEINKFDIRHGEPITDRKSTFQGHLAVIMSRDEAHQVLMELKKNRKIANASHNIMAYRILNEEKNAYIQDCDDDGENAAGSRLLHLLQITGAKNVIVVVTRWYGGLMLGPDRFKHYNNSARTLLQSAGLVESKSPMDHKDSKGKSKTKVKKHK